MTEKKKLILGIILFGSVWGGLEALGIDVMRKVGFHTNSPVLALVGILILAMARMVIRKPGSTLSIGVIAAGIKFLGLSQIFFCQIFAVVAQAAIFDLAFSLAEKKNWITRPIHLGLVGIVGSYVNYMVFSFSQAYVFANPHWTERGLSGLFRWIFTEGSYAAILSFLGIIIGVNLGRKIAPAFTRWQEIGEKAYSRGLLLISLGFWLLGIFAYRF
jgi:xanthosine utilization system XapX-like protein